MAAAGKQTNPDPIKTNVSLGKFTNFGVGGRVANYWPIKDIDQLATQFKQMRPQPPWMIMGGGTNLLISDKDLPGSLIHLNGRGRIQIRGSTIEATADCDWDRLVKTAVNSNLWGVELLSGIPGTVGGGAWINISAYGQSLADSLKWVEVFDCRSKKTKRQSLTAKDWGYKRSPLAAADDWIVTKICLGLSQKPTTDLLYETALDYGRRQQLDPSSLKQRRQIIIGTRAGAGSLQLQNQTRTKTCGSFFKNPIVSREQAQQLGRFDETGTGPAAIATMNQIHGRDQRRVSAAHVLLAAGFRRGQAFGSVRLHPDHVLKIENYRDADAQAIYAVAKMIQARVWSRLKIKLEFEVATLGDFSN